jgi:prephenate dehydrogenase
MKEVGIIGYGRFGRLAAHHLKKAFKVSVADSRRHLRTERGVRQVAVDVAAGCDAVILAVPINSLPKLLHRIRRHLRPEALVCDVCSVKERPVKFMLDLLPKEVSILGTHPLFGPDTAGENLRGRTIVLSPVRIAAGLLKSVRNGLSRQGLEVRIMTPKDHDRLMAETLFLSQFVGRGLHRLHLSEETAVTQGYSLLRAVASASNNDTLELFRDMYAYNRFASPLPSRVLKEFKQLSRWLTAR